MFDRLKGDLRTAVVAVVAASVVAGPAAAAAVYVANADKVDNKHAVGAGAGADARKGKLVATSPKTGRLPNNIIGLAPDSDRLDGFDSADLLPGQLLPAGATIRGAYHLLGRAPGDVYAGASEGISFGYVLSAAPQAEVLTVGESPTSNCPGTADQPEAAPGYLCIYETDSQNKRHLNDYPSVGWGLAGGQTRPFGVHLTVQSGFGAGFFWSRGSWAVTAP